MKRFKFLKIGLLLTLLLISGCASRSGSLIEIGNQELATILEESTSTFVYVGTPTCPVCVEFEPILEDVLNEIDKELYYFNIYNARQEDVEKMQSLLEVLEVLVTPTIVFVENGEVIGTLLGLRSEVEIIEFFETYGAN